MSFFNDKYLLRKQLVFQDIILLTKKKTENIEKILNQELTDEEKIDLSEAIQEHSKGRTISLAEAEKVFGL